MTRAWSSDDLATFVQLDPGPDVDDALHDAYHAKYDRYGAGIVRTVVSAEAARCTLRLVPAG